MDEYSILVRGAVIKSSGEEVASQVSKRYYADDFRIVNNGVLSLLVEHNGIQYVTHVFSSEYWLRIDVTREGYDE